MIRNIVFDMGNVILRFDPELFLTRENITDKNDRAILLREVFHSEEWVQMDWGLLTEKTAEPFMLARLPEYLHETAKRLLYRWWQPIIIIPGMDRLVSRLKEAGYNLFLLSNASVMQHEYWPDVQVSRLFDGKMLSCDVRMIKPMPEIYNHFTETFGLVPDECLFVDDSPVNIVGAKYCGWHGITFRGNAADTIKEMEKLGVQL